MPQFLQFVLIGAAIVYVFVSRFLGQAVTVRRTALLPVILTVIGGVNVAHAAPGGLKPVDWAYLVVGGIISAGLGLVRGRTIKVYPKDGYLYQRYVAATAIWWVVAIVVRLGESVLAPHLGTTAAIATGSMLLSVGLSLVGESAVVVLRGASSGTPLAPDQRFRS